MENKDLDNSNQQVIQATHKGAWTPPGSDFEIECYVLENGDRVFSLRGTARTMGLRGNGALALPRMLNSNYIQPYLSEGLKEWLLNAQEGRTLKVRPPEGGNVIHAFKAELIVDLSDAFYEAKVGGKFVGPNWEYQSQLADRLHKVTSAFSKLGINALIDEVTGYQEVRENNALQQMLSHYVEEMFQPWVRRFPEEFYKQIYRLKNWKYTGSNKRTPYIGKLTNQFIYDYLPDQVMELVRERNNGGNTKLHQWLSSDVGLSHLDKQIVAATALMRASESWEEFEIMFKRSFDRNDGEQTKLL